jgi:alpha-methylacyl-CoA racemase
MLMGNMGAEIIKVEDAETGDPTRYFPPIVDGVGSIFRALNTDKESIALNLKSPAGQRVAQQLAARSDVVVEGFRPGVTARLGIDFESLSAANSRLVYCSISGYGQHGSFRDLPGHDLTYAAMSGLLDALFPESPRVPGVQIVDAAVSLLATIQILANLRLVDSGPRYVDVSLYDAAQALMPLALLEARHTASQGSSVLDQLRGSVRNDVYSCADDRWIAVTPLEEHFWQRFCAALRAKNEWEEDRDPGAASLEEIFRRRSAGEWTHILNEAGVPCAPVRTVSDASKDGTDSWIHPSQEDSKSVPALGEHTHVLLRELGYTEEEMKDLEQRSIIRTDLVPR